MKNFISALHCSLAALLLTTSHFLSGCATPSERFITKATALNFNLQELNGVPYSHRLFVNAKAMHAYDLEELHVYLDGDGTPWKSNLRIADDPTPRNPLILELMKIDQAPAILLGRPCYYGLNLSHDCNNSLWTSHRYSKEVLNSMLATLKQWLSTRRVKRVVLIGFSGGGTLAALLAPDLDNLSTLVTISANLDIKAWSDYHGYLQPSGSLNPIRDAQIPATIRQIHLAGQKDDNVPADIVRSFSAIQHNALYLPYPEYDHACCWPDIWESFLKTYLNR